MRPKWPLPTGRPTAYLDIGFGDAYSRRLHRLVPPTAAFSPAFPHHHEVATPIPHQDPHRPDGRGSQPARPGRRTASGRAAHLRQCAAHRPGGHGADLRREREADAGRADAGAARRWPRASWPHVDGAAGGAPRRPRTRWRCPTALAPALACGIRRRPCTPVGPTRDRFVRSRRARRRRCRRATRTSPTRRVTSLSRWIESRALTSERLTRIYLDAHRSASTRACARSSPSRADHALGAGAPGRRRDRAPATTAARCTAFPTA